MKWYILLLIVTSSLISKAQECPPLNYELMRWSFLGFPKTNRGWGISIKYMLDLIGDHPIRISQIDATKLYKSDCYFYRYSYRIEMTDSKIEVIQVKDTLDKYSKLKYPGLYK